LSLLRQLRRLNRRARAPRADLGIYRDRPDLYCEQVLRVRLTPGQGEVCRLIVTPPYRVLVKSGHNVGKSFLAACLVSWWFDTRNPGVTITTAPTDRQVKDILWKEVRRVRGAAGLSGFSGPKIPRLETSPDHFAYGFTARDATAFQGQHDKAVLLVFDEAEGIPTEFWDAAHTMLGGVTYGMVCFYNPTTQSGPTVDAENEAGWHSVTMNCVDHPNIRADLDGNDPPYPSAIRLERLTEMLDKWGQPIALADATETDVVLGTRAWRPGPVAEARLLGRRPSTAFDAVWSVSLFEQCCTLKLPDCGVLQIGCDVARFGDDMTAFHVRRGGNSLHHETHQGLPVPVVAARGKELAYRWGNHYGVDPRRVIVAVDDAGIGGGVTDCGRADGWNFIGVNGASSAPNEDEFPNMRSALWFGLAELARRREVSFALLAPPVRNELRRQLTAPVYTLDLRARRVVEQKIKTKERLGRSPDDADSVLLAYASVGSASERVAGRVRVA
jgi:hypothetical protein